MFLSQGEIQAVTIQTSVILEGTLTETDGRNLSSSVKLEVCRRRHPVGLAWWYFALK